MAKQAYLNILLLKGRSDRLEDAWQRGRPYFKSIEASFEAQGLPPELAKVAIIESLFTPDIVSKAGAVGAYQFMTLTARSFLLVDDAVDGPGQLLRVVEGERESEDQVDHQRGHHRGNRGREPSILH